MRQAMFTFMAEAGEEKKPAGAPLPHMRQQTARPAHTRHLAEMVQPGKPEVSRRDLTLAEWTTLLSTVETFIRDVARHLTNSDRDFCANQLRVLGHCPATREGQSDYHTRITPPPNNTNNMTQQEFTERIPTSKH